MIATQQRVRVAGLHDHQALSSLLFFEPRAHRHLDWRAPLDWLGSAHFWVLEEHGTISAALACPQDPPGMSWIRLFVAREPFHEEFAWPALWSVARKSLALSGAVIAGAIVTQPWFQKYLTNSMFASPQSIVLLERASRQPAVPAALPPGFSISPLSEAELPTAAEVDADAFPLLWQYSLETLRRAYAMKLYATALKAPDGRMLAYQLSSGDLARAHLARLAVRTEAQGGGLGAALVADLISFTRRAGIFQLTVNTQCDNDASLKLYGRLGFTRTGEELPVFTCAIQGGSHDS